MNSFFEARATTKGGRMSVRRLSKKVSRFEALNQRQEKLERALKGEGLYVYRNRSKEADLDLPKPTKSGQVRVGPGEEWQGDNYYMHLVRSNMATLVREIYSPDQEKVMNEQKLLVDQPETVTAEGTVEHVVAQPGQVPLNEGQPTEGQEETDVLLNEDPLGGVDIILD